MKDDRRGRQDSIPTSENQDLHDSIVAQVREVERQWVQAHLDLDLEILGRILDERYAQLQPGGRIIGKRDLLESYSSGRRHWEVAASEPIRVEVIGEAALLFGRWTGRGVDDGVSFDYRTEFLAVYRRRSDGWKLVAELSFPPQTPRGPSADEAGSGLRGSEHVD